MLVDFSKHFPNFFQFFLKTFHSFRSFDFFSGNRSHRDDAFGLKIVKFRAILADFRSFEDLLVDRPA